MLKVAVQQVPSLTFEKVSENAEMVLQFDRPMIIPNNLHQVNFSNILDFTLINEE